MELSPNSLRATRLMAAVAAGSLLLTSCSAIAEAARDVGGRPVVNGKMNKDSHGVTLSGHPVAVAAGSIVTAWCHTSDSRLEVTVDSAPPTSKTPAGADYAEQGATLNGTPRDDIDATSDPYNVGKGKDPMEPLPNCDNNKNTP